MIDPQLSGKTAIVTGINNPMGIGAAIARALCAQDVRVFGTYLRYPASEQHIQEARSAIAGEALYRTLSARDATEVVNEIRAAGGEIEAIEVDLADVNAPARIVEQATRRFEFVDIVVCNAAAYSLPDSVLPEHISQGAPSAGGIPIAAFSVQRHDRHFQVNVRAAMLLMREFAARVLERGTQWGRIITVSTDGASGFPTEISYGASKHALESLTRAAASELGPYGITANVVSLGPIQTGYISPDAQSRIAADTPLRRVGRPDDVADVVTFLASEQARWLTGQLIYVGGGHAMHQ